MRVVDAREATKHRLYRTILAGHGVVFELERQCIDLLHSFSSRTCPVSGICLKLFHRLSRIWAYVPQGAFCQPVHKSRRLRLCHLLVGGPAYHAWPLDLDQKSH